VATASDGAPLMLLSNLALHAQNLDADPRASLLIDGTSPVGDPLAGGRVSVGGRVMATAAPDDRRRFLARHPGAAAYADFADFVFHRLEPETAHFVGGFGRIVDIAAQHLLTDLAGAGALVAAEADIVHHMNADHADAVGLYAAAELRRQGVDVAGGPGAAGPWRMLGLDPDGCDLEAGGCGLRIAFAQRVTTPETAQAALVALARAARGTSG
jgi:putative heme iron utilization protein